MVMQRQIPRTQTESKTMEIPITQGDQACRVPTDFVRQGCCRYACGDAVKGPSVSECTEDSDQSDQPGDQACRVPIDSTYRQGCCRYGCGDAVKGPSDSGFRREQVKSLPRRKDAERRCRWWRRSL